MKNAKTAGMVLFFATGAVFTILSGRLFFIAAHQNVAGHNLSEDARQTFMSQQTDIAERGRILTNSGEVLAENTTTYNLYAVVKKQNDSEGKPAYVVDRQTTAEKLSSVLDLSTKDIMARFDETTAETYQIEFGAEGRNLSAAQHQKIVDMKLPGIGFTSQSARQYPDGRVASHIVGATQNKTNQVGLTELSGLMGIEASQNKLLAGVNGLKQVYATPNYEVSQATTGQTAQPGDDVYLTLDDRLQTLMEDKMDELSENMKPKNAVGVLMEAKTGRIVAATQRPNYNPNNMNGIDDMWSNLLVQNAFEPGSVLKGMTLAAAVDTDNWHPDEKFTAGSYTITGKKINDYAKNLGVISYREGFAVSSNTAFARVQQAMGADTWYNYLEKFGFLKSTQTGFNKEEAGAISYRYPIEQANTAFGQGIRVTPAQLLQAYTAIANDGKMIQPYIVDKVVNPENGAIVKQGQTQTVGEPIKAKTAQTVLDAMVDVVNMPEGTAREFDLRDDGYQIAAKTGTAQISKDGEYLDGLKNTIFSLMSVAPADDPQYIFYMAVTQPDELNDATPQTTMAKLFKPVMLQALNNSSAAVKSDSTAVSVPDVTGKTGKEAAAILSKRGLRVAIIGDQAKKVETQSIPGNHQALTNQLIVLKTDDGSTMMPDMTGWSLRDVQTFANMLGSQVVFEGSGYVVGQNLATNNIVTKSQTIEVTLKQKE
jgi:penicillin-binding protein 2B